MFILQDTRSLNVVFLAFPGIIGLSVYALYQYSGVYLLVYLGIILMSLNPRSA
jgi:hypothetical protein